MTSTRLLRLAGEIDYSSAPAFDALLQSLDDAQVVTLDFSGVTFFDSSALGCLIRLRDRMRAAGSDGTIQLLHPSATVRRILEVTGLDRVFVAVPDDAPEADLAGTDEPVHQFGPPVQFDHP